MTKEQKTKIQIMAERFIESRAFDSIRALDDLRGIICGMLITRDKRIRQVQAVYEYIERVYC